MGGVGLTSLAAKSFLVSLSEARYGVRIRSEIKPEILPLQGDYERIKRFH